MFCLPIFSIFFHRFARKARSTILVGSLHFCVLTAATLSLTLASTFGAAGSYAASIEKLDPFDTTGLESNVANILRNYYERNFTDAENWNAVESLRFDGTLHLPQRSLPFAAFKKKPDLCKIVLRVGERHEVVMAYDGQQAWQLNTRQSSLASKMTEDEARNFIRDATAGGRLLYPGIEGKTIELVGTTMVDGERAYELRITLPDGQVIRSFLEMDSFAEVQQITINNVSGGEEVTRHGKFRMVEGVRIPYSSILTIDGEQVNESRIDKVRVNQGVTPWMFNMPAIADEAPSSDGREIIDDLETNTLTPKESRSFFDVELDSK